MRPVSSSGRNANAGDPFVYETRVLARAHVFGVIDPAREGEVAERSAAAFEPSQQAAPCRVEQVD